MRVSLLALLTLALVGCATAPASREEVHTAPPGGAPPPPRRIPADLDVRALPACPPPECPPVQMGMPNWQCADGDDQGGPVCKRLPGGQCGFVVVNCPVKQRGQPQPGGDWQRLAGLPDCAKPECPPTAPRLPSWQCADGRRGGPACKRKDDGACGWVVIRCPH